MLTRTRDRLRAGAWAVLLSVLSIAGCNSAPEQASEASAPRPWLHGVTASTRIDAIHTVRAEADVKVSDGTEFRTAVLYHDPMRAAFRSEDAERTDTMGIDGDLVFRLDETGAEVEADPFVREFVLGHQFHAQILFFDRLHPGHAPPQPATFNGVDCHAVQTGDHDSLRALYYDPADRPLGMRMHYGPEMQVSIAFEDWREVGDLSLPFRVRIDDGRAEFVYHYADVGLNEGSLSEFRGR